MKRLVLICLAALAAPLAAGAADCQFGCCVRCGKTCYLKAEPVTEEEPCYEVECKEVCIPAVRFPWESCRTPKCGRVRVVTRLVEESREVRSCDYEWVIVCPGCGTRQAAPKKADVPPAPTKNGEGSDGNGGEPGDAEEPGDAMEAPMTEPGDPSGAPSSDPASEPSAEPSAEPAAEPQVGPWGPFPPPAPAAYGPADPPAPAAWNVGRGGRS